MGEVVISNVLDLSESFSASFLFTVYFPLIELTRSENGIDQTLKGFQGGRACQRLAIYQEGGCANKMMGIGILQTSIDLIFILTRVQAMVKSSGI